MRFFLCWIVLLILAACASTPQGEKTAQQAGATGLQTRPVQGKLQKKKPQRGKQGYGQPIRQADSPFTLTPVSFSDLKGWAKRDKVSALKAFHRSCAKLLKRSPDEALYKKAVYAGKTGDWQKVCALLASSGGTQFQGHGFFEDNFEPFILTTSSAREGLLTGYFEPQITVRRRPGKGFDEPLLAKPRDILRLDMGDFSSDLKGKQFIGQSVKGRVQPYPPRSAIVRDPQRLQTAFAWGRPVDVFFLQIQGSGRLVFEDGHTMRAAFAAHNGRPYRSVGRELIRRKALKAGKASKSVIEAWMNRQNRQARRKLMNFNPRYVFFDLQPLGDPGMGPKGAHNTPLQAMASLAIDPAYHAFGMPLWLETRLPEQAGDFKGREQGLLVITQDQGGAIKGPLRGDLFFGSGDAAGARAGVMFHKARWIVLLPKGLVQRIKRGGGLNISEKKDRISQKNS